LCVNGLMKAIAALLVVLALSGCSAIGDVVSDASGGKVNVGNTVPADFPTGVPLTDGDVVAAASVVDDLTGATVWNVTISTDSTADDIASELKAAGFAGSDDVIANFPQAGELVGDNLKGYTNGSVVVVVGMQALPTGGSVAAYAVTKLPG